ncbi:MAG: RNA polymerase sigma factor [Myxococcales bacterium]|nr:RNA polymerase sigma factor [Myxococcales bacterium]MCB9565776.1 RNA polymerase sigma factor [Myxococcales bacterium]MCB9703037.1 RNA polymerase sigma factor [Myxococcales bacterium]
MRSDHELLEAWRGGDPAAGRELFGRHFTPVFRFFRNKVDDAADDLTQQTFMACLHTTDRFRGDASFRTYIFAIARRRLYDHLRQNHRRGGREEAIGERSIADLHGPSPTRALVLQEEQELLLRALRRLPLDMQVALELFYWEELSIPEISEVLETPTGTIKRRLQRARHQLDAIMAELASSRGLLESTLGDFDGWARGLRRRLGGA